MRVVILRGGSLRIGVGHPKAVPGRVGQRDDLVEGIATQKISSCSIDRDLQSVRKLETDAVGYCQRDSVDTNGGIDMVRDEGIAGSIAITKVPGNLVSITRVDIVERTSKRDRFTDVR